MITSFEVGSVFTIVDRATPTIARLSREVGDFGKLVADTKKNLQALGTTSFVGLNRGLKAATDQAVAMSSAIDKAGVDIIRSTDAATASVMGLANAWRQVGIAATSANARAATASRLGGSGGGRGAGIGPLSFGAPRLPLPGGGNVGVHGANAAMAGAGIIGYGIYQESILDDAAARAVFTDNSARDKADFQLRQKAFRDAVDQAARKTGYPIHDLAEAGLSEVRQLAGLSWEQKIGMLPTVLQYAAAEARLKGTTVEESASSLIGLAHMTKTYDPAGMAKLFSQFGYLSTITDMPLQQMVKAYGYSVPILEGSGISPTDDMLLQAVMARSGITSTKSGTWLRQLAIRALPATSLQSRVAFRKHEAGLRKLGLVDDSGRPTWFGEDGHPDLLKLLQIAGERLQTIPESERASLETQIFGQQGAGGLAVLSDPTVLRMIPKMKSEMSRFRSGSEFFDEYSENSSLQAFRETWGETRGILMDIGRHALPLINPLLVRFDHGLKDLDKTLGSGIFGAVLGGYATGGPIGAAAGFVAGVTGAGDAEKRLEQKGLEADKLRKMSLGEYLDYLKNYFFGGTKEGTKEGAKEGARQGVIDGLQEMNKRYGNPYKEMLWQGENDYSGLLQNAMYVPGGTGGVDAGIDSGGSVGALGYSASGRTGNAGRSPMGSFAPGSKYTGGPGSGPDPRGLIPYIREQAIANGIDPDAAVRVARSEGLGEFVGDRGTSFGAFQLHVGGGLGDQFRKETGLNPADPKNEKATIAWAMKHLAKTRDWSPWHGAAKVGIRGSMGIGGGASIGDSAAGARANFMHGQFGGIGQNLTDVMTAGGHRMRVNAASAPYLKGFVEDLEKAGAPIHSLGGFRASRIAGTGRLSQHAYGNAIDIDQHSRNVVDRDFSAWAGSHSNQLRAALRKWGIISGGDWRNPDFGHFEWGGVRTHPDTDNAVMPPAPAHHLAPNMTVTLQVDKHKLAKVVTGGQVQMAKGPTQSARLPDRWITYPSVVAA